MALTTADLANHLNLDGAPDGLDTAMLQRLLSGATAHVQRLLGFKIDDATQFPDGTPADLELAILQLAADWYENREASLVGVTAQPIPFGVASIVAEYRNYTFGTVDNV